MKALIRRQVSNNKNRKINGTRRFLTNDLDKLKNSNNLCHADCVQPGGSVRQQLSYKNEIEHPVMAPPEAEEKVAPAKVLYVIYRQPENESNNRSSSDDETIHMDETISNKFGLYIIFVIKM